MDAVSEVLIARTARTDGLSSMLGASAMAHIVLVGLFVFLPAAWFGAEFEQPETIMQISLGGPIGPNDGGLATLGRPHDSAAAERKRRRRSSRCVRRRRRRRR